jgi:hypothetical protein
MDAFELQILGLKKSNADGWEAVGVEEKVAIQCKFKRKKVIKGAVFCAD